MTAHSLSSVAIQKKTTGVQKGEEGGRRRVRVRVRVRVRMKVRGTGTNVRAAHRLCRVVLKSA